MAETEFIGPGGIVRQTILNNQGQPHAATAAWATIKPEPHVVATAAATSPNGTFYPTTAYEWKVADDTISAKKTKHRVHATPQQQPQMQQNSVTVSLAPVEIKPIPQTIIAQCSNAWSPVNTTVTDINNGYQTIKWEAANPLVVSSKPTTTLNTTGLHFISAPAGATAAVTASTPHTVVSPGVAPTTLSAPAAAPAVVPAGMNVVIHGGRKTGTIIETFKCEVCNQVFSSMNGLQNHVAQVHEVNLNRRQGKKSGFAPSTLHCEYKYSGLSLADSISTQGAIPNAAAAAAAAAQAQAMPAIIATGGHINTGGATFIQAPTNLTITSIGGTNLASAGTGGASTSAVAAAAAIQTSPQGIILNKNNKMRKEKKRNWECVLCHNRFSRKDHLAKHVSAVHEKIRPFECVQCGQKFSQKHHLRAHMLARHEDDKMAAKAFACQICPKRFTRNDHLERHIESGKIFDINYSVHVV